eukprot:TCALIF_03837-PA protein Name:"Similar to EIF2AK3 Eukaryotic translation initiation factor 2-alpha kinase 3 (Homo sapiens)" AED:0.07 eAED:0.07 QI:0/0.66/0.5/1/0.66/0.5/4/176/987
MRLWTVALSSWALWICLGSLNPARAQAETPSAEPPSQDPEAATPRQRIPYCPPEDKESLARKNSNLIMVSTLDGKISALDPAHEGRLLWSVDTGPAGSMLSSTISQMELTNAGKFVKLIPSLGGGLYKFDGETLEAVPLSAEALLRSSFKFADNTIITGGRENRRYGIEMDTGMVRYECAMDGCRNFGTGTDSLDDIIVVHRETQTVRAIEPRTGHEKWNFSVSQHNLDLFPGLEDLCHNESESDEPSFINEDDRDEVFKAVVSDGVICSVKKAHPDQIVWKRDFQTPIVHAWEIRNGKLFKIDLFSTSAFPSTPQGEVLVEGRDPLMYVASHNKQLYIQESERLRLVHAHQLDRVPKVSWRPYLLTSHSRTPHYNHGKHANDEGILPLLTFDEKVAENTALAVFTGSDYPYDSGLYLFPEEPTLEYDPVLDYDQQSSLPGIEDGSKMNGIDLNVYSLYYWWKEVTFISILTALLLNVILTQPVILELNLFGSRPKPDQPKQSVVVIEVPVQVPAPNNSSEARTPDSASSGASLNRELSWQRSYDSGHFESRYLADFEPVQCLGKGGFGVVFEAKNKLDDNKYAVKRIRLPKSDHAKKKVMREVKFLAKLEHRNIVRYYNTWLESPPPGWQEDHDKRWRLEDLGASMNEDVSSMTRTEFDESGTSLGINTKNLQFSRDCGNNSLHLPPSKGGDRNSFSIVFEDESSSERTSASQTNPNESHCSDSSTEGTCEDALEWDKANWKEEGQREEKKSQQVYLYIVMQLCQKQSLRDWLRDCVMNRSRQQSLQMFHEICLGVEYVHSQQLIHRDLKPGNIFFSTDGTVKIGDFGLVTGRVDVLDCQDDDQSNVSEESPMLSSHNQNFNHTDQVGTELYMSPEQIKRMKYNYKVDIYSLGLILFELLVPFSTQMERLDTLSKLRKLEFPDHFINQDEYHLVKAMLSHSPDERPDTNEVLESEFMALVIECSVNGDVGSVEGGRKRNHSSRSEE